MEQLFSATDTTKMDIFSDPSHRISQRPRAIKSGEGIGFQDMGSSFSSPKPAAKSRPKPVVVLPAKPRKVAHRKWEDESDDELLLSSQNSAGSPSPPKRVAKGKNPHTSSGADETVHVNGRILSAHPDYKPSSLNAIKELRFKKNRIARPADSVTASSSSPTDSQELSKPISNKIGILGNLRPRQPPSDTLSTRRRSPGETRITTRPSTSAQASTTAPKAQETRQIPPKPRPRPRVIIRSTPLKRDSSPESTPRPVARKHGLPLRSQTPKPPTDAVTKHAVRKPPFPSPLRRELQEFPMSLRAKENISDSTSSGDVSSFKTKKAVTSRTATSARGPKPMPLLSPLRTKSLSRESTFPVLSPLSSSNHKGKERAHSPDHIPKDAVAKRNDLKPFPMSSEMLAGINTRSKSPSPPSSKSTKRASSDDSGAEQGHITKKRKDSRSRHDALHEPIEEDSIDMGYVRDPSKLCPYCDEELPSYPTPFLQNLLATARKKSAPDPRPRNRRGLKAPLTIYISVCQRHRFESHQLPIAAKRGWPKTIDFTKVPARVKKMKHELEAIISDKDDFNDVEDIVVDYGPKGPRSRSVFWREVSKEVKKQGSRTVVGVKGQFASFEKAQPGYYGEQGSVIIHQTLFDLFPPSTFDASLISPLVPAEFIQRILLPEAAVRLIAQDLRINIEDAIITLRESAQYGVAMFPDTTENKRKGADIDLDDEEMGIADQIVMERARARRKELAEEEKVENEMLEEARAAQRAQARERQREKALERARQAKETKVWPEGKKKVEEASEVSDASTTTVQRTRRGTRHGQRGTITGGESESDAMSVDSVETRRSVRTAKKGTQRDRGKAITKATSSQIIGTDSYAKRKVSKTKTMEVITDLDARMTIGPAVPREWRKPFSFGTHASADSDGEHESTPRPARGRTTTTDSKTTIGSSNASILPLQIARNRSSSGANAHDGWSRNLRTPVPDDSDSDASLQSQRLDRSRIKKDRLPPPGFDWLWSRSSSVSPS